MKKLRPGLRARLAAALLLIVSISSAGFYAVAHFIEFHESEVFHGELAQELQSFAQHPYQDEPAKGSLKTYVVASPQDLERLPPRLRDLAPGLHDDIHLDGTEYLVGREDINGKRFYVLMNTAPVEALETRFITLVWVCAIVSWSVAMLLALWLSNLVMRPISRLAALVAELQPKQRSVRLAEQFDDREIGLIADAFDRFLARLDDFVAREQAFTEDASHELRTPLTIVLNAAQLLEEEPHLTAIGHKRLQRILRAAQQMQTLIEALLFLAREEGDATIEDLAVDLLAQEAALSIHDMVEQKGLLLNVSTTATQIHAPRGMVNCVINNLLVNAVHYTSQGQIELQVAPGRMSVQDTGGGIPPQDIEHIFEHRYRGAQSHGHGLGLYLVKRICDRLGWIVEVSSVPGVGTRFDVKFPEALRKSNVPPTES